MVVNWVLISLHICVLVKITNSFLINNLNLSYGNYELGQVKNIRETFLNQRRNRRVTDNRVKVLNQITGDSVLIDGIVHHKIDENHLHLKEVDSMENGFRNLLAMKGVTYIYKRDTFWRTWRKVKYSDGKESIIHYRRQTSGNCTNCQYGAYWLIDDVPPACSYEIVSVITNEELCAANTANSTNIEKKCPSIYLFMDVLRLCDNPMETKWQIHKEYDQKVSEQYPAVLCDGRYFCEISTFYMITHDYVSFRIINSTSHIIYSRIMKNGMINYACVKDCGKMDPKTKTVLKTDEPLVVDLLNKKKKRDDTKQSFAVFDYDDTNYFEDRIHSKYMEDIDEMKSKSKFHNVKGSRHHKDHINCASLKHIENYISDEE